MSTEPNKGPEGTAKAPTIREALGGLGSAFVDLKSALVAAGTPVVASARDTAIEVGKTVAAAAERVGEVARSVASAPETQATVKSVKDALDGAVQKVESLKADLDRQLAELGRKAQEAQVVPPPPPPAAKKPRSRTPMSKPPRKGPDGATSAMKRGPSTFGGGMKKRGRR